MKTTLNTIKEHEPFASMWENLLRNLNKTEADDEPLDVITILDASGIHSAIWCFRVFQGYDKELKLFALRCAQQVRHLIADHRHVAYLDTAERFASGQANINELTAAERAAQAADLERYAGLYPHETLDTSSLAAMAATWAARAAMPRPENKSWFYVQVAACYAAKAQGADADAVQETELRRIFGSETPKMQVGLRYVVTKASRRKEFRVGDEVWLQKDGSLTCPNAHGWMPKEDVPAATEGWGIEPAGKNKGWRMPKADWSIEFLGEKKC